MAAPYDSAKAATFNQLIQGGASIADAYRGAGIDPADAGNYGINNDPASRNFGRLGPADENNLEAPQANSPNTVASYGTSYTQPAQSFGAINLSPTDQDTTGYVNPIVSGVTQTSPPLQELNFYPPQNVETTTVGLTGVQFDVAGFPVAQTQPTQVPFNTAPGAVADPFRTVAPAEDSAINPVNTTTSFPGIVATTTGFGAINAEPDPVNPAVQPGLPGIVVTTPGFINTEATPVDDTAGTPVPGGASFNAASLRANLDAASGAGYGSVSPFDPAQYAINSGGDTDPGTSVGLTRARDSNVIREQRRNTNNRDWRVRLRLAPRSNYLYNDPAIDSSSLLFPLKNTDGVIFPYTPSIQTSYNANYSQYDLTHSNYKGYFYQSSNTGPIQIQGTFTAQSTDEADYLLAVIHFFRSATKMFYGQDADAGAPPPLMYLSGLGNYQFNEHPVLLTTFSYNLPNNVDYIRCNSFNQVNVNLLQRRTKQTVPSNPFSAALARLQTLIGKPSIGADPGQTDQQRISPELGGSKPTYVPTQMDISISLLPVQSRQQVSKQFSVKAFANGDLLQGGFW